LITTVGRSRKVDVRLIASTSANLHSLVAAGEFREDLFFKLAVITLSIPALADRMDDLPLLAEYFLRRLSRELMRPDMTLATLALEKLMSHRWPGNIRELENTLRRAATLSVNGQIDATQISFLSVGTDNTLSDDVREGRHSLTISGGLLINHQREVIVKALDDHRWNFTKTAAALGIGRTTLWRKVKKYNLAPASGVTVEE
jgi:DNA-binding NtrC family response regulator